MRSPGNAVAFWAKKNCTVAAQTRTRMERFIFFASSLYKFRLHLHHPYSSSFAKNLHFPTPHPCPLLEPAFARLRRGRRRGEVPKCQPGADLPRGMLQGGSAAPRAMLNFCSLWLRRFNIERRSARSTYIELATGRVRPSADKGLLDPPQQTSQSASWVRRRVESRSASVNVRCR